MRTKAVIGTATAPSATDPGARIGTSLPTLTTQIVGFCSAPSDVTEDLGRTANSTDTVNVVDGNRATRISPMMRRQGSVGHDPAKGTNRE